MTMQYLLIVCIEIYTFVNTYNRLQYIFGWIHSDNCDSNQNRLALSETHYKANVISVLLIFHKNMPAQKCHFRVCRRW